MTEPTRADLAEAVAVQPRKLHHLRVWPDYFDDLLSGLKPFELRKNDRDFRVGDELRLCEWSELNGYTGREISKKVSYMLQGGPWLAPGYACLGLAVASPQSPGGCGTGSGR